MKILRSVILNIIHRKNKVANTCLIKPDKSSWHRNCKSHSEVFKEKYLKKNTPTFIFPRVFQGGK